MTLKCKFSPLGKPDVDPYAPGTVVYENRPANNTMTNVSQPVSRGVYELMCCSGGGGEWCYIGCNQGAAGSFFKGEVYFDDDKTDTTPILPDVSFVPAAVRLMPAVPEAPLRRPLWTVCRLFRRKSMPAVSAAAVRFSPEPTTGLKKQPDI